MAEIAEINPRKKVDLNEDDLISFVPMAAVDEMSGTIAASVNRPYGEVSKGFTHFRDEDVIFAKITPSMENGKSAVARGLSNGTGMGSTEFHVFRSYGAIEPDYLWRYVRQQSFRDHAKSVMSGAVGQQRVPADWLKEHVIPLAPIAEQRRIVEKVDSLTTRTARARKELDRIPALISRYKQRLLALAFSGELIGKRPSQGKAFESGCWNIPNDWHWVRFSDVAEIASKLVKPDTIPHLPHIAPANIEAGTARLLPYRTIAEDKLISAKNRFYPGQVLYSKIRPYLKKAVIVDFDGACSADMYPISARTELHPRYLLYWLISDDFAKFSARHEGRTVLPKINKKALNSTPFPLPNLEDQGEIVGRIESAFGWLDRLANEHDSAANLLPKLDGAILEKAFLGELVPQDPSDEPASVLLEQTAETQASSKSIKASSQRSRSSYRQTPRNRKPKVTKSRRDDDVWQKPYLAGKLKKLNAVDVQSLFLAADLPVADFYKQLAWEVANRHIFDDSNQLKAT